MSNSALSKRVRNWTDRDTFIKTQDKNKNLKEFENCNKI